MDDRQLDDACSLLWEAAGRRLISFIGDSSEAGEDGSVSWDGWKEHALAYPHSLSQTLEPFRTLASGILSVVAERDEADRRAGAAERELALLRDGKAKRDRWFRQAKEDAGYSPNTSFDVVWTAALAALEAARDSGSDPSGRKAAGFEGEASQSGLSAAKASPKTPRPSREG